MKFKYNLEYNYFSVYDEVQGIIASKFALYRNESTTLSFYTKNGLRFIKYAIVLFIFMIIFKFIPMISIITNLMNLIFALLVGGIVTYYVIFFTSYSIERNRSHKGEILIDEEGVLDISEDKIKIGIPWHYIESVIITDNIICFMSKAVASLVIPSKHYEAVITAIEKYQNDVKILDKRSIKRDYEAKYVEVENIEQKDTKEDIKTDKIVEEKKKTGRPKKKDDAVDKKFEEVEEAIKELTEN